MSIDKRRVLAQCPLLRGLSDDVLDQLSAVAYVRHFADGAIIHLKGDPPEGLFGVVRGAAKVCSLNAEGKEMVFTILESGSWFGEVALFDGKTRSHNVSAMGATDVVTVPVGEFHRILQQQPNLYPHFLKLLAQYIRMSYGALEDQTFLGLQARLAKKLLNLADNYGVPVPEGVRINLHLPQEEIARMLGASRQSVSTELNVWERNGWLEHRYGRMLIRDRKALEALFED